MKRVRPRLTYANVVSTVALVIAVGGASAFAATHLAQNSVGPRQLRRNAVTNAKIKNGAVTGAKIKLSTLGTVPSARHAASAESAGRATTAGLAERANSAAVAAALIPPEPIHLVGGAGEPPFENGFVVAPGGSPAGFYKDRECVVHLLGAIEGESQHVAFRLPPADAPTQEAFGAIAVAGPEAGNLTVNKAGWVEPTSQAGGTSVFGLDGFSFRALSC
ncbi:MAG: hypothetical protein JST31_13340 [Actinobacteria bacterium]|nr:hypothetical protein [Actinomycetota bacterium]